MTAPVKPPPDPAALIADLAAARAARDSAAEKRRLAEQEYAEASREHERAWFAWCDAGRPTL